MDLTRASLTSGVFLERGEIVHCWPVLGKSDCGSRKPPPFGRWTAVAVFKQSLPSPDAPVESNRSLALESSGVFARRQFEQVVAASHRERAPPLETVRAGNGRRGYRLRVD